MSSTPYTNSIRTNYATVFYNDSSFIKTILDNDSEMELEDIIAQRELYAKITLGKRHVILVIAGARTSATKEAREYAANNPVLGRLAEAVIIKSMSVRILGNVYINFNKPKVPTKLFKTEEEAEEWLRDILNQNSEQQMA
ncbi:MAG: hypothetical protein IPM51_04045 [Sphingobacteriaceae bacterium]|nr:hypothetical protein [Sphingobacteriaceae bacterium]